MFAEFVFFQCYYITNLPAVTYYKNLSVRKVNLNHANYLNINFIANHI